MTGGPGRGAGSVAPRARLAYHTRDVATGSGSLAVSGWLMLAYCYGFERVVPRETTTLPVFRERSAEPAPRGDGRAAPRMRGAESVPSQARLRMTGTVRRGDPSFGLDGLSAGASGS